MDAPRRGAAPLAPLDAFPPHRLEDWREAARAELALAPGADVEAALAREADGGGAPALVLPTHVRGTIDGSAAPAWRAERSGWLVAVACDAADGAALAEEARHELAGGATAVWLRGAPAVGAIERLEPALVRSATWLAPDGLPEVARALAERGAPQVVLGADPCARRARQGEAASERDLDAALVAGLELAERAGPGARGLLVDASLYHEAGAGPALELGALLAALVDALGRAERAGRDARAALARVALRLSVGQALVEECAKLRAARVLVRRVAAELGVDVDGPWIHAVAARRSHSTRDPWVNLLRGGASAIAAVLGGADAVTTEAHDALTGASETGRRAARNLQLVLAEEAHLGRVLDPLAGSHAVEEATERLARAGFEAFRAIERGGGLAAELASGAFARRIEVDRGARARALAERRRRITGVTASPAAWDPAEAREPRVAAVARGALRPVRDAEPFERLARRARAGRSADAPPCALVIGIGRSSEHRERTEACRSFFQTAALEVRVVEAPADVGAVLAAAASALEQRPAVVCLSASDERLAPASDSPVAAVAARLAGRGERVWVAGAAPEHEEPLRAAGVQVFLRRGQDALGWLAAAVEAAQPAGAAR